MSMNIGAMLRALFKDATQAEGRALELKVGQIVRGVLMEMLDDGDALMNIGGALVRARLETELQAGKGTLLQVMPGSNAKTVILKSLGEAAGQLPDEGLKDVLKSFGLPEQKWAFDLLRGLRNDGYPMNKETASYFQGASMLKPASADLAGWMAAADVAFRRGLPNSQETINALRQALFGQPLREQLAGLADQLDQWLQAEGPKFPKAAELAGRLQSLMAQGEELLIQGRQQLEKSAVPPAGISNPAQPEALRPSSAVTQQGVPPSGPQPAQQAAQSMAEAARMSLAQANLTAELAQQPARTAQPAAISASAQQVLASSPGTAASQGSGNAAQEIAASSARPSGVHAETPSQTPAHTESANPASAASQHAAGKSELPWIGRLLQWMGISHEHKLAQEWGNIQRAAADQAGLQGEAQMVAGERSSVSADTLRSTQDTLKSLLLTMARMEDLPPQIREAVQALVHHITGQQLLLASERQAGNPISIMTLFVPMKGADGETAATIHVQTRRGRKGEWDIDNCRLLFDLNMRYLGETIVDVQVIDRIVSVKLMNDFPAMAEMAAQARGPLEEGLRAAGFQLLSMTVQPYPAAQDNTIPEETDAPQQKSAGAGMTAFTSKPYKGVDYRV